MPRSPRSSGQTSSRESLRRGGFQGSVLQATRVESSSERILTRKCGSNHASTHLIQSKHVRKTSIIGIAIGLCRYCLVKSLMRSEEHTSELQSRQYLVCRLL